MRRKVFVDASAWVALLNPTDKWHTMASSIYRRLIDERITMITTNWMLYEALSVLKARGGLYRAEELWNNVMESDLVQVIRITEQIEEAGLDIFFRYRDKPWGVVDCISFVVMREIECFEAFAFDRHFAEAAQQMGFKVLSVKRKG